MQYRTFGRLDWKVSALGFGAMRLPTVDGRVDAPEATRMIRYAIDHGVNYVDTAYPYHDGESEQLLGRALQDGYRERVKLVTKIPSWFVKSSADFDRFLDLQLERLQQESVDMYLLHALNKGSWEKLRDFGVLVSAETGDLQHRRENDGLRSQRGPGNRLRGWAWESPIGPEVHARPLEANRVVIGLQMRGD